MGALCLAVLLGACGGRAPDLDGRYFPLPDHPLDVVRSESQAFLVDTVLTGLNRPWSMEFLPDGRVLITERLGRLVVVEDGIVQDRSLAGDIPSGLRDIQLHPRYDDNQLIYLSYYVDPTDDDGGYTVLMRGTLDGNHLVDKEILYRAGPFHEDGSYFGSRIAFDEEGYLFFLVGGRTMDERHRRINIQDPASPSGKAMRLNDDGTVPVDNPFVDSTGALPEMYSLGHRQHQGLVRHPETGEMWSTEHGEMEGDELNLIRPGRNYGWPLATYSREYDGSVISEDPLLEGTEPPVHYWTPGIAPSGLDFVTGERYPGWSGDLFVGSLSPGMLNHSVMEAGRVLRDESLLEGIGRVRSVRQAPDGFLYLVTEDTGVMVRLLPAE